jgi:hypothetical protein
MQLSPHAFPVVQVLQQGPVLSEHPVADGMAAVNSSGINLMSRSTARRISGITLAL